MTGQLTIGQLAGLTQVPPKTIRYYEQSGILPTPRRSNSNYRLYSETDVRRLEFIRRARLLDMTLPEVRELVEQASSATCNDFQGRLLKVVQGKLEELDGRILDLQHLKGDLQRLEVHLTEAQDEEVLDHAMLECSPQTCSCLGGTLGDKDQRQEVKL